MHRRTFLTFVAGAAIARVARAEECGVTSAAVKGPYWRPGAPFTNDITQKDGEVIAVHGVVRSARTCKPVPNALLDVWQADHHGDYDDEAGRARVRSGSNGEFSFRTVRPAPYGSTGWMRPAHIHFQLSAEGHRTLITQLYFEGDPYLDRDPLRAVHSDLIGRVRNGRCEFDIFLG
ncbi:MAG TPA: hypothetical protein VNI54_10115 [Thermoanaerobaculia bacterium]|nr:hypothetical protein [Thermoanaerobaculia bacterium]